MKRKLFLFSKLMVVFVRMIQNALSQPYWQSVRFCTLKVGWACSGCCTSKASYNWSLKNDSC